MYSDDQPRDSRGRFASNNSGQRLSRAAAERAALYKKQDESLYHNTGPASPASMRTTPMDTIMRGLRQQFGDKAPSEDRVRQIMASVGSHSLHVGLLKRSMQS